MNITVTFTDPGAISIKNTSPDPITIPFAPGNSPTFKNGISIVPPNGTYFGIDSVDGGALLMGPGGPLEMPPGSSAVFNISA